MLKRLLTNSLAFLVIFCCFFALWQLLIPKIDRSGDPAAVSNPATAQFSYLAIGDSLTEGVGDETEQGGFVSLVKQDLANSYAYQVKATNAGIAGQTSRQILNRMQSDSQLQKELKEADLLTLTLGGNDVLAVVRKELTNLSLASFDQPLKTYQANLEQIIAQARQDNAQLPIYIVGIYNPFYLSFPELTEMQTIVDEWNQATADLAASYEGVYFVPVDHLLAKGLEATDGSNQTGQVNDLLFSEDNFHPNQTGYQLMAQAIMEKINETKTEWTN